MPLASATCPRRTASSASPGPCSSTLCSPRPLCAPSRAVIVTGRMPHNTEVFLNDKSHGAYWSKIENTSVAVALQHHGYVTFLAGKFMNG